MMTHTKTLTKPQADMLLKSMRNDGRTTVSRQRWRTATNLCSKGFFREGSENSYYLNRSGLAALADYWMRKDAASGCVAFMETRREVEEALEQGWP